MEYTTANILHDSYFTFKSLQNFSPNAKIVEID